MGGYIAEHIAVLASGRVVEIAPRHVLCRKPVHSYTQALLRAVPYPDLERPLDLRLIASGERSGELPRMLDEAAAQQQRELDRWLTVLTAVLGPAVILAVGAMVLFIVLAILLPIFNLNQMVK